MNLGFNDAEIATKFGLSIGSVFTVRRWLCLKVAHLLLQSYLEQASLVLMNGNLVSLTCPKYNMLVLDNL